MFTILPSISINLTIATKDLASLISIIDAIAQINARKIEITRQI